MRVKQPEPFDPNREYRPGMFGNKGNERGNGIHQPPWNATLFSLLKWEIRKWYRTIGNKPRKQSPGFCRLYT